MSLRLVVNHLFTLIQYFI